jgi:hypothetical protein
MTVQLDTSANHGPYTKNRKVPNDFFKIFARVKSGAWIEFAVIQVKTGRNFSSSTRFSACFGMRQNNSFLTASLVFSSSLGTLSSSPKDFTPVPGGFSA